MSNSGRSLLLTIATWFLFFMCGPTATQAQYAKFSIAPGQTFGVELDSADGHRSEWFKNGKELTSFSAFRAACTVLRIGPKGTSFGFNVWSAELNSPQDGYGLELRADSEQAPIRIELRYWDRAKKEAVIVKTFEKTVSLKENFLVELVWSKAKLRVAVSAKEAAEVALPYPVSQMYISSTTGNMRCQQAALGTAPL